VDEQNSNTGTETATVQAEMPRQDPIVKMPKRKGKAIAIVAAIIIALVAGACIALFVYSKIESTPTTVTSMTITPTKIVESFKIVSLELYYKEIIDSRSTDDRKLFGLIPGVLEDKEKILLVKITGKVFMGIDVDKHPIKVEEQYDESQKILKLTIPKAEIIAHETEKPIVVFNEANHTENYTLEEYIDLQDAAKLEVEAKINNGEYDGLIYRAQESAEKQLESLLNSIPDIRDNYRLVFVLE
jgi:hypothetical protein